jgi:hypothetical protein
MAPRHETSGAGSPDPSDNKSTTPSKIYGTRSSKRKVSEMSKNPQTEDVSTKKRATRSTKKFKVTATKATEDIEPPTKKLRSSATEAELTTNFESTPTPTLSSETPQPITEQVSDQQSVDSPASEDALAEVIATLPETPSETTSDGDDINSTTPATFDDVLASQEPNGEEVTGTPSKRGRGGRRGRGRGGKLSMAAKKKAAKAAREAKAKSIAQASPPPLIQTPTARRGGRRKATINPRIDALKLRTEELKTHYYALVKVQQKALRALSGKSLEMVKKDPVYHEQVPEYSRVSQELRDTYDARHEKLNKQEALEFDVLMNARKYNEKAIEDQFNVSHPYESCVNLLTMCPASS